MRVVENHHSHDELLIGYSIQTSQPWHHIHIPNTILTEQVSSLYIMQLKGEKEGPSGGVKGDTGERLTVGKGIGKL